MKPETADQIVSQIQQEISKSIIEYISELGDNIEAKFSQLQVDNLQQHDTVMNAISNNNNDIIIQLKSELEAKDAEIKDLLSKESQLKG